jgi:hypothetical protein
MAQVETNEGTKFTEEEMEKINKIKVEYNESTIRLGQIAIDKLLLEEEESSLAKEYREIRGKEIALAKELSKKYGVGNLDLETGVFVPAK